MSEILKSELEKARAEIARLTLERRVHLRLMGILPARASSSGIHALPRALGRPWIPRLPARGGLDQVEVGDETVTVRGWACCPFFNARTTRLHLIARKGGSRVVVSPSKECREDLTPRSARLPWPLSGIKPRRLEWAGFHCAIPRAALPQGTARLQCFIEQGRWTAACGLGVIVLP